MGIDHVRILANIIRQKLISFLEFIIVPLFLIASLGILGWTVWKSFAWFQLAPTISDHTAQITAENEIMRTVAQIFGGAFVLIGIYFSAKSTFIAREGQMAERFSKALENFGDEKNIFKRIGGVYSLERIARDSPNDHWDIMEIFTNYIRNQPKDSQPQTDIQAILNVIKRRDRIFRMGENRRLDLQKANLQGVDLSGAHLEGANLCGANLSNANLSNAELSDADLTGAILEKANLNQVRMNKTNLKAANLRKARLRKSKAKNASFAEANLQEAELDQAVFDNVIFTRANLNNAILDKTHLSHCSFNDTTMSETSFIGAVVIAPNSLIKNQLNNIIISEETRIDTLLQQRQNV